MADPLPALPQTNDQDTRPIEAVPEEPVQGAAELMVVEQVESTTNYLENSWDTASQFCVRGVRNARIGLRVLADEYPLQLVMGVAIAGFVVGAALGLWRGRDE